MTAPIPNTNAYFCATCGSAAVSVSELGGPSTCQACGWKGPKEDLAVHKFSQDLGSSESVTQAFISDVVRVFSKECAIPLGRFLVKWGFLEPIPNHPLAQKIYARHLGRYVHEVAKAATLAIVKTREAIELERVKETSGG